MGFHPCYLSTFLDWKNQGDWPACYHVSCWESNFRCVCVLYELKFWYTIRHTIPYPTHQIIASKTNAYGRAESRDLILLQPQPFTYPSPTSCCYFLEKALEYSTKPIAIPVCSLQDPLQQFCHLLQVNLERSS